MAKKDIDLKPTEGMKKAAQRGLDLRAEHGRGGTEVGIARARDIVNNKNLSPGTVKRMYSFFSRHEGNKKAKGFRQGEEGYPSNGLIAWLLWGGDSGFSWSKKKRDQLERAEKNESVIRESIDIPNNAEVVYSNDAEYLYPKDELEELISKKYNLDGKKDIIKKAIEEDPENEEVYLKLLKMAKDKSGFNYQSTRKYILDEISTKAEPEEQYFLRKHMDNKYSAFRIRFLNADKVLSPRLVNRFAIGFKEIISIDYFVSQITRELDNEASEASEPRPRTRKTGFYIKGRLVIEFVTYKGKFYIEVIALDENGRPVRITN